MDYFTEVTFGFAGKWREYKDWLKAIPGVSPVFANGKFKAWRVPVEMVELAWAKAVEFGVRLK